MGYVICFLGIWDMFSSYVPALYTVILSVTGTVPLTPSQM
jgi:hypothetical protein